MKTLLKICLFAVAMATGCSTVGCCGGIATGSNQDCGAKSAAVTASGTFTDSANGISATISGASIFVERESAGGNTVSVVELTASNLNFSSPSGITSSDFICSIDLASAPSSGTVTQASTGVTGGVTITYDGASTANSYSAETGESGSSAAGTWTLNLSSATEFCGGSDIAASVSEYTVHGSLTASMIGSAADGGPATGTLNLTF